MAITSLTGINSVSQQASIQNDNDKLQAALASITTGTIQNSGDVAEVSPAGQLQAGAAALKSVSGNLTQALSLTQVAGGGISQIQQIVGQLQSLASEAVSPVISPENRKQLNQQFQQLSSAIDTIASTTSFNGSKLLDGSISGESALSLDNLLSTNTNNGTSDLSIPDLSTGSLFGSQNISLLSSESANQAITALDNASGQITGISANVGAFQQTLTFAAANVESALTNQQAAQSTLSDTDVTSTAVSLANIQENAALAFAAQGNNLNPALLQLVG